MPSVVDAATAGERLAVAAVRGAVVESAHAAIAPAAKRIERVERTALVRLRNIGASQNECGGGRLAVAAIDSRRGRDVDAASREARVVRRPDQIQKRECERVQKLAPRADVDSTVTP